MDTVALANVLRSLMLAEQLAIGLVTPVVFAAYWRSRKEWMVRKDRVLCVLGSMAVSTHAFAAAYDTLQRMDGPFRPTYAVYIVVYALYLALLFNTSAKANRCITRERSEGHGRSQPPAWMK